MLGKIGGIKTKNFLAIVAFEMIFAVFFCVVVMYYTEESLKNKIRDMEYLTTKNYADLLDGLIESVVDLSYEMSTERSLPRYHIFEGSKKEEERDVLREKIALVSSSSVYIEDMYLYFDATKEVLSDGESPKLENMDWYDDYCEMNENDNFLVIVSERNKYPGRLTLIYRFAFSAKNTGAVVVVVKMDEISEMLSLSGETRTLLLLDKAGNLCYSNAYSYVKNPGLIPEYLLDGGTGQTYCEEDLLRTSVKSRWLGLRYVCVTSVQELYTMNAMSYVWVVLSGSVVISILGGYLLSRYAYQPIRNILDEVGRDAEHTNEQEYIVKRIREAKRQNENAQHEISELTQKFSNLQMVALQKQIDPHFIYNTIDAIRWMSIEKNGEQENQVADALVVFARMLRGSFRKEGNLICLKDEIESLKEYIYLTNICFGGEIIFDYKVPEELYGVRILRMCLQPLIENAILHGLKGDSFRGRIVLEASAMEESLIISVGDNGVGMTEEECFTWNKLLRGEYVEECEHVGVQNVNQRIRVMYGDQFGVLFRRGKKEGTEVILYIPFENNEYAESKLSL